MWCPERSPKGEVEGHDFIRFGLLSFGLVLPAMFFCYILECSDGSFYVGVSDDPERRLIEHNQGKGSDWTAVRRPVKLVWTEEHPTLASARLRENQLKRWGHANKAKLIGGSPRLRSGQA